MRIVKVRLPSCWSGGDIVTHPARSAPIGRQFVQSVVLTLIVSITPSARAHGGLQDQPADTELAIHLLTFGPGSHPFFKFGHLAILVRDPSHDVDLVYNFGAFNGNNPHLISDFIHGRFLYWLEVTPLYATIATYIALNRTIEAQVLDLSPEQKRAIYQELQRTALPQNRYYKYHYYKDNCATRVRDIIDRTTGGRLAAVSRIPGSMTWREHTRRYTADYPLLSLGLDLLLSDAVDRPITLWDEMFLPRMVQLAVRRASSPVVGRKLVRKETVFYRANRPPIPDQPPRWTLPLLVIGAAIGVLFAACGRVGGHPLPRVLFGAMVSMWGMLMGLLGVVFAFIWLVTDQDIGHHNENLLQCAPLALGFLVTGVGVAVGKRWAIRGTRRIAMVCLSLAFLGILLKLLPWFRQNNWNIIALILPVWAGIAAGSWWMWKAISSNDKATVPYLPGR